MRKELHHVYIMYFSSFVRVNPGADQTDEASTHYLRKDETEIPRVMFAFSPA